MVSILCSFFEKRATFSFLCDGRENDQTVDSITEAELSGGEDSALKKTKNRF